MRILAFSFGDPNLPKTWSGVPYYSIKAMENKGHEVFGYDIRPDNRFSKFLIRITNKFFRFVLGRQTLFTVEMLPIMKKYYIRKVKSIYSKHKNIDLIVYYSYSIPSCEGIDIPCVLFCDFTGEYAIHYIQKRKIKWYEKKIISSQDQLMKAADRIVSLFPNAADHYSQYYNRNDIRRIPGHIINSDIYDLNSDSIIKQKIKSNNLLFIGRKNYRNGALCLINAVKKYNCINTNNKLNLTIIGMGKNELNIDNENIELLGYLDKGDVEQRKIYYNRISNAKIIINTTKNWGGISSVVESMYFYTPVITTAYQEFVEIFGNSIDFGMYSKAEDEDELYSLIESFINLDKTSYTNMCNAAHNRVNDYSWPSIIETIIK